MATNTITLKIHFNIHDVRQVQLAENFNEVLADNCRMFDELKAKLVNTQPDHATVAWLTDMINKDFEELSEQTAKEFAVAKRDSEARYDSLEADLAWRWERLLRPTVQQSFDSWTTRTNTSRRLQP